MQRDNALLAIKLFHDYQTQAAQTAYHAEVVRIEEEYKAAKKGIKDKLVDMVDERKKKLKEEKEADQTNLGELSLLFPSYSFLPSRCRRNMGSHVVVPMIYLYT